MFFNVDVQTIGTFASNLGVVDCRVVVKFVDQRIHRQRIEIRIFTDTEHVHHLLLAEDVMLGCIVDGLDVTAVCGIKEIKNSIDKRNDDRKGYHCYQHPLAQAVDATLERQNAENTLLEGELFFQRFDVFLRLGRAELVYAAFHA